MTDLRRLGQTDIWISPIGLGCWQFSEGRGLVGSFWEALPRQTVYEIVRASLDCGVNWFDTAEAYGGGRSEAALARSLVEAGKQDGDVVVATKWAPFLTTASNILKTFPARTKHLGGYSIDLHQIHMPHSISSVKAQMMVMADLVDAGKIKSVGVSNFSEKRMREAHAALSVRGIPLASNQVRYSLLDRSIERGGVIEAAKELGITIIAYSPLAQGLLTGRFHKDPGTIRTRPGPRKWMPAFRGAGLERSRKLVEVLGEVARVHGVTPGQVALRWLLDIHGETMVAIPGASREAQAIENANAMRLRLDEDQIDRLDQLTIS